MTIKVGDDEMNDTLKRLEKLLEEMLGEMQDMNERWERYESWEGTTMESVLGPQYGGKLPATALSYKITKVYSV